MLTWLDFFSGLVEALVSLKLGSHVRPFVTLFKFQLKVVCFRKHMWRTQGSFSSDFTFNLHNSFYSSKRLSLYIFIRFKMFDQLSTGGT